MRGELIGQAADLAPAHGVGLAGDRERPHARPADAAGREMAIDDRVDLVGAAGRLVDALRKDRDDALGRGEPVDRSCASVVRRDVAVACGRSRASPRIARAPASASSKPVGVRGDVAPIERAVLGEIREQTVEQRDVAARRDRQMQIGMLGGRGAARIDRRRSSCRACALRRHDALEQHRMAPGEVGADQHDQVGLLEILVVPGTISSPKARLWPATEEAMQSRELVSILALPMKPFISLLAT